jgi:hypothetical protein
VRALCRAVGFWATLAFIVSSVVSPILAASKNPLFGRITRLVSLNNHLVTELCPVPLGAGERIIIICPSPYKDAATGLCGDQFFSIDCEHKSSRPGFWANKRLARLPFIQIAEIEVCGYIALENFHTTMIDQMFCGGVASVLQSTRRIIYPMSWPARRSSGVGPNPMLGCTRPGRSRPQAMRNIIGGSSRKYILGGLVISPRTE